MFSWHLCLLKCVHVLKSKGHSLLKPAWPDSLDISKLTSYRLPPARGQKAVTNLTLFIQDGFCSIYCPMAGFFDVAFCFILYNNCSQLPAFIVIAVQYHNTLPDYVLYTTFYKYAVQTQLFWYLAFYTVDGLLFFSSKKNNISFFWIITFYTLWIYVIFWWSCLGLYTGCYLFWNVLLVAINKNLLGVTSLKQNLEWIFIFGHFRFVLKGGEIMEMQQKTVATLYTLCLNRFG